MAGSALAALVPHALIVLKTARTVMVTARMTQRPVRGKMWCQGIGRISAGPKTGLMSVTRIYNSRRFCLIVINTYI
jgi:hypothetical protein